METIDLEESIYSTRFDILHALELSIGKEESSTLSKPALLKGEFVAVLVSGLCLVTATVLSIMLFRSKRGIGMG